MKNLIVVLIIACVGFGAVSCSNKGKSEESEDIKNKIPVMSFVDSTLFNFGDVKEGDVVEKKFRFKNKGEFPLIINNITSSCGCTTPEWPREPIAPNEESAILVRFNTKGKMGPQMKTITVYANTTPATTELNIQGVVNAAPDSTASKK
jgi:hypothetical protein